jgi:hypothetical protein
MKRNIKNTVKLLKKPVSCIYRVGNALYSRYIRPLMATDTRLASEEYSLKHLNTVLEIPERWTVRKCFVR